MSHLKEGESRRADLPDNSHHLVEGQIHIDWGVLGTGLYVGNLQKITANQNKGTSVRSSFIGGFKGYPLPPFLSFLTRFKRLLNFFTY